MEPIHIPRNRLAVLQGKITAATYAARFPSFPPPIVGDKVACKVTPPAPEPSKPPEPVTPPAPAATAPPAASPKPAKVAPSPATVAASPMRADAISALTNLGWKKREAAALVDSVILESGPTLAIADVIRQALAKGKPRTTSIPP